MNSKTVIEVLDKLIGDIHASGICETNHERYKNLICLEDVVYYVIDKLANECSHSPQGSTTRINWKAAKILSHIRDEINAVLGEEEGTD